MAYKLITVIAFLASTSAVSVPQQYYPSHTAATYPVQKLVAAPVAPVYKTVSAPVYKQEVYDAPAEYDFSYAVHDEHTGDIKSQQESRKGDVVHGRYELIEPDGHRRIVEYTADDHNGFNAVVHREDSNVKVPVYKAAPVQKLAYAAPVVKAILPSVAKVAYAAPIAKVVAPVSHYSAPAPFANYAHAPVAHYPAPAPVAHHYAAAPAAQHYAPAPVAQHYAAAPVAQHYAPAPVAQHYVPAPVAHYANPHQQQYSSGHQSSQVSFSGPSNTYLY